MSSNIETATRRSALLLATLSLLVAGPSRAELADPDDSHWCGTTP